MCTKASWFDQVAFKGMNYQFDTFDTGLMTVLWQKTNGSYFIRSIEKKIRKCFIHKRFLLFIFLTKIHPFGMQRTNSS